MIVEYHKIITVYERDPETKFKTLINGKFAEPEFEYLQANEWTFTEKIDGTNIRVMFVDGKIIWGGKSDSSQIPTHLITKLQEMFNKDKMLEVFPDCNVCLCGEGYGHKIQKAGDSYIPNDCSFILFDIQIGGWWLQRKDVEDIAVKLGIDIVPIVGQGTLQEGIEMARNGFNSTIGTAKAEGLVMRPKTELKTRAGKRIITKIKHKDFTSLLNKETNRTL